MKADQQQSTGVSKQGTADTALRDWASHPSRRVRDVLARPAAAWLLLGIGLVATAGATAWAWRQIRGREEARFLASTEVLRTGMAQELDRYIRVLNGARALWRIHPPCAREEWRAYVESLDLSENLPGLRALAFIELVPSARLAEYEEQVRRDSAGKRDHAAFRVQPQTTNDERFVVRFIEPLEINEPALGFDIGSEPLRRQAAERARDTGIATLSRKIMLVQAPQAPGVLLLLPLYAANAPATDVAQRRANLRGWVDAAFVVEDLLARVRPAVPDDVEVQIFDGTELSPAAQLVESQSSAGREQRFPRASLERTATLACANAVWTLRFRAGPNFRRTPWFAAPGYMAAGGIGVCISLLLFGIAQSLAKTRQRAQTLAEEMTVQLRLQHHAMASAKNGLFILDASRANRPIIYANPAFETMTGYSVKKPLGERTRFLLTNGAERTDLAGVMHAMFEGNGSEHTVVREYRRAGSQRWVEFRLVPVLDEGGRTTHLLGIVDDVTERKRAQEQLLRAEQRYRELVNNVPVGIYRNTPGEEGRFAEVNPALVAMFEAASKEELMSHSVSDLYADPARRKELSERLARQGYVTDQEVELKTLRGHKFWGSVTAAMRRDEENAVIFEGVVADITERKEAERALRESQERFALAVQGASEGIWDWNVVTNKVYFSPLWKSMLGYEDHEVEDTFAAWERLLHPEDRARASEVIQDYFSGRSATYELEHRLRHKDGTYRWILARGVALRDAQGKPLRMAGSHVDLTARRHAEEQLRRACAELSRSQEDLTRMVQQLQTSHQELKQTQLQLFQAAKLECLGTLAAGVAHEVKNPLQTIVSGVDYLSNTLPSSDETSLLVLGEMRDAVRRAKRIIQELLQLSAGKEFELREEDINEVLERSLCLVHYELAAARTKVVRQLQQPLTSVRIDRAKIEQVLINLFLNALQAMSPPGVLTVTTRDGSLDSGLALNCGSGCPFRPNDRLVVVEVQDTGPGIPAENLARVFDPFFTTKAPEVGTGLGLSVAKKIIDLHQGVIAVRNAPEGGTLVTLVFRAS